MKVMRKLILGAVSTGFVAVALAATTYAWYKLGNAAFTKEFEFNASTTDGFLVSVDGVHFKHKLTTADMVKAMIIGKNPVDYQFDSKGNLIDVRAGNVTITNNEEIVKAYVKAQALEPVTTSDGKTMKGLSGGTINEANDYSSKYAYFNLYFRTAADLATDTSENNKNLQEDKEYSIYLDGLGYNDGHYKADKTEIWSNKATNVKLVAPMTTYNANLIKGDTIQVYTANASRLSAQSLGFIEYYNQVDPEATFNSETTYYVREGQGTNAEPYQFVKANITEFEEGIKYFTVDENEENLTTTNMPNGNALIYELSSNDGDLGSYATNYNGADETLNKLYNANYNAMYTYYNNIKTEDKLDSKLMDYEDLPTTIRSLTKVEDGQEVNRKDLIATVKSGYVTKVAFRFWIEGWDGDCFDGLPGYFENTYKEVEDDYDEEQTYYTRSGNGTDDDPYVYTRALIDGFETGVTYYQIDGQETKEVNPINARLLFNSI